MPPPLSEAENLKLMYAMIKYLDLKQVNWDTLGKEFGINEQGVRKRWSKFCKKMDEPEPTSEAAPPESEKQGSPATPSKRKRAAKSDGGKSTPKGVKKQRAKKEAKAKPEKAKPEEVKQEEVKHEVAKQEGAEGSEEGENGEEKEGVAEDEEK
ncbi:hypothetical protein DFH27DRAFT_525467 [Peziza echinospora]|nr:hypothetical protein DFH27DRAFT_525467 [Peziza echinospora]